MPELRLALKSAKKEVSGPDKVMINGAFKNLLFKRDGLHFLSLLHTLQGEAIIDKESFLRDEKGSPFR
jgi:hypothetical protein